MRLVTRLAIGLLWILHWLPLPALAAIGNLFGGLGYLLAVERRRVALTNLRLCFPDLPEARRRRIARAHFRALMRGMIERGLCWWGDVRRLRRLVRVEGLERFRAQAGKPVILLVPHFVALDLAATRLTLEGDCVSMFSKQKDPLVNALLYRGRTRFGDQHIVSRQDGIRAVVKSMRRGRPVYYLPDMDYGRRNTIFVPFFGVPAATVPGVSRLARLTGARVLPCLARMLPAGAGYVIEIRPPWEDFPGESVEADTLRMNRYIERCVLEMPEQYYWVHKRFKTRPPGAPRVYD